MKAPYLRAEKDRKNAPAPVRRIKGNALRRHWLTGAFATVLMGVVGYASVQIYQADQELKEVRQTRAQVEATLREEQEKNVRLQQTLEKVTSDENMELMAKKMGFTRPNEKVYQTSPSTGQ